MHGQQAILVAEVLAVAKSYGVVIDQATELIARLDVISSLAHVAVNAPAEYVRPTLVPMGTGHVDLIAARHPCMEWHESVRHMLCVHPPLAVNASIFGMVLQWKQG